MVQLNNLSSLLSDKIVNFFLYICLEPVYTRVDLGFSVVVVAKLLSVSSFQLNWRYRFCLRDKRDRKSWDFSLVILYNLSLQLPQGLLRQDRRRMGTTFPNDSVFVMVSVSLSA